MLLIGATLLCGCMGPPPALEPGPFADIMPQSAQEGAVGERVRWGGKITASRIDEKESCFEVAASELDLTARPWADDGTQGSFYVCLPGFYDPAIYQAGRMITITGTVHTLESHKAADRPVLRPQVQGESIYLWPPSHPYREWGVDHGWWGPFWDDDC